jgi:hypothetical protein
MADPWSFFAALSAWRMAASRRRTLCESPWLGDQHDTGIKRRFVLARAKRATEGV